MFEQGDLKYVILHLLAEKPRHGYEVIKELEVRFAGSYAPSAGTVYPTLSLLEDMGYDTGVDLDRLIACARRVPAIVGHDTPGQVMKAGRSLETHAPPPGLR